MKLITNDKLTIGMYHYVRELNNSRYPNIKGLELELFREQIAFFKENYNIISCKDVINTMDSGSNPLPEKSLILTFDDGYIDHYTNVFPILKENNLSGFFSMPGRILAESKLLDVNKIHFILASTEIEQLMPMVFERLDYYRGSHFKISDNQTLYEKLAAKNRYDDEKTIFVKRLLQVELQEELRNLIVDDLFKKLIPISQEAFAKELYMSYDQIKLMKSQGMEFGIHGYDHYWMGELEENEMKQDIEKALDVFDGVVDRKNWVMCYPYGSFNKKVIQYCTENGCKMGFNTDVRVANLKKDNKMILPRLDANDFPPKSEKYLEMK